MADEQQFDPFGDPCTVGILGMASGLLEASGPRKLPISMGQALGMGLQRGILDRGKAEEIATQKMLREAQVQTPSPIHPVTRGRSKAA